MLNVVSSACVEASQEEVWKYLSDIENLDQWSEPILSVDCDGQIKGVGAERTCCLRGGIEVRERWTEWVEGQSYTYVGTGFPLAKIAKNTWTLTSYGDKTLITSTAEVEAKGGVFGKVLELLMLIMSRKMASDSLAAFKYLVENGEPYPGKHSKLPRAPVSC